MLRNPPVNVGDWLEPVESEGSDPEDELHDEEPLNGDQDPPFVERMAPPGLDAIDKPEVGHEELAAFLEAHLHDMDEDEWIDICRFYYPYH